MTILPKVNLEKDDETIPEAEPPPAAATPLSPNRFGGTSPGTSSGAGFYPPPRTPPSPSRDREKPFNTDNWEVERRDGGRRRRRVVGTSRTVVAAPPPRSPISGDSRDTRDTRDTRDIRDTRERNNSDDEYDANSVYDWNKEKMYEKLLQEKKGYNIMRCAEDGACLFRSVADQLYGDQEMHGVVRTKCMDYMVKNRDYFSQFVTEDYMSYVNRKRQDNCYGNQLEMQAMSEMYNRPIEVYIYSLEPVNTLGYHLKTDNPPLRLSYHCDCHYNSVRDPYEPSVGVGLGLPGYKPGLADQQLLKDGLTQSEADDIERIMMQDKLDSSDMEATADAITAAIARDSYMEWVKQNERGSQDSSSVAGSSSEPCYSGVSTTSSNMHHGMSNASESASSTMYHGVSSSAESASSTMYHGVSSSAESASSTMYHGVSSSAESASSTMYHGVSSSAESASSTMYQVPGCSRSSASEPAPAPHLTPPHSSTSIPPPPPSDSSTIDTIYPVYGLDEYDEDKMLEAALALSRAEYVNRMQKQ